ncbi:hypothetical protein Tco_0243365 [Tanacetum coccineum]
MGMDWLSKRKFGIVCHEKVVRIPLEGDEMLRVHGERTQGVVKTLKNTKVEFHIDLVHGATSVAKSPYRLTPLEMQELSENFEIELEFTEEEKLVKLKQERSTVMTIQSSVRDKILATPSETSKYEYEIRYHPGKANVVIEALSRKERVKPRRVRAMAMYLFKYGARGMILTAKVKALKQANFWLVGMTWMSVLDEADASWYLLHTVADKMYYNLGSHSKSCDVEDFWLTAIACDT